MERARVLCVSLAALPNSRFLFRRHLSTQTPALLRRSQLRRQTHRACSSTSSKPSITLQYERGLPLLTIPLPSRAEPCLFSLRPLTDTVGTLCEALQKEDKGLDYVALYTKDSTRISMSLSVEHLLQLGGFRLRLNDAYFDVTVPEHQNDEVSVSSDRVRQLDDLRATVATLHASLCIDEYKVGRERKIVLKLEQAETELKPLQQAKLEIEKECELHSERVMWAGFAAMGVQTGIFARLTWWEYSWDIMEPITYFATYGAVLSSFGYYLYTRQSFEYPLAKERVYTKQFYKRAHAHKFDIERYNTLVVQVANYRRELRRIRDPLFQHLPVSYLSKFDKEDSDDEDDD